MVKVITDEKSIDELLTRGVEEVIVKEHLTDALRSGKPLRVKFGIDPTAPDLHLGHTVPLRKLRQFQDLGHTAILIIGDYTARIGDPTGRSQERKPLTEKEIKDNMKKYLDHAAKVIDVRRAEIVYNSKWLSKEGLPEAIELFGASSLQQVLHRADFKKRLEEENDITLAEVLYPVLQGYDSVKIKADVEIGGTDQKFNLLMGRRVQRHFKMPEQDIMTLPLIEGTDGIRKMSKSFGNTIGLDDDPNGMFGKVMSVSDDLINKYYELLTSEKRSIADPREAKLELAREIVKLYHGEKLAKSAKEYFVKIYSKKDLSGADLPEFRIKTNNLSILDLVLSRQDAKMLSLKSKTVAKQLISEGAVQIGGKVKKEFWEIVELKGGETLKIGRNFFRIKIIAQ